MGVEQEKDRFPFDVAKRHIHVVCKPLGRVPVEPGIRDGIEDRRAHPVPHRGDPGGSPGHLCDRNLDRMPEPHDPGDVLGPAPPSPLLCPTVHERRDPGPPPDIERPHPLRTAELVGRESEEVDLHRIHIHGV